MSPRLLTLLTDYGPASEHVGALHAVLAAACPTAGRLDLAHDVPPGDVRWGGILLARLAPLALGAVHLAVVDPGVGTERRGLAVLLAGGGALVGPDNGLLGPAAAALGAVGAVELTSPAHRRAPVAPTFHGRDVFAPAAAHLALGGDPGALGSAVDPAGVAHPEAAPARVVPGRLAALVAGRDRFGNVALLAGPDDLARAGLVPGDRVSVRAGATARAAMVGRTFADVPPGALLVHLDAHGMVAVAVNGGDAAAVLGVAPGAWVSLEDAEVKLSAVSGDGWLGAVRRHLRDRAALRRCLAIALVVGTVLTGINEGDRLLAGDPFAGDAIRVPLNYVVPFVVSSLGFISARRS